MKTILTLVLFIVIGFIASRVLYYRARLRLSVAVLFLTGVEFFFLGVLLGPGGLGLIGDAVLEDLKPVIYLALGWAGLLFGIQLSRRHLQRVSRAVFRLLVGEAVLLTLVAGAVTMLALSRLFPEASPAETFSCAAVLALTLSLSSPTIVHVLARMMPSRGPFTNVAKVATSLSAVVPLFAFGLLSTIVHPAFFEPKLTGFVTGLLWWLFANAVGVVMGFIVALLIVQKMERDDRLLLIMGTALFVGGICFFLKLSALYTSMIMGIVIGNFSRRRVQLFEQLLVVEKTIYIAFLILVGAMVSVSGPAVLVAVAIYVLLRLVLKTLVTSWRVRKEFPQFAHLGVRSGFAFAAQGAMALAIALDYRLLTPGVMADVVLTVVALAVVANEFIGIVLARWAFRAAGEVRARRVDSSKRERIAELP